MRRNKCLPLIIDKSPYLKKLENRKNAKISQNEEDKANYLLDKVLGRDNSFTRDYNVFFKCSIPHNSLAIGHKFSVYNPGIKLHLKSRTDEIYPKKYVTKSIEYDKFAMIYRNSNRNNNNNQYSGNKPLHLSYRSSALKNAGASVVNTDRKKEEPILLVTQNKLPIEKEKEKVKSI